MHCEYALWIYIFGIDLLFAKFECWKFDTNQESFYIFTFKFLEWTIIFLNVLLTHQMCNIPYQNWRGF
jgi:hypothetical protein